MAATANALRLDPEPRFRRALNRQPVQPFQPHTVFTTPMEGRWRIGASVTADDACALPRKAGKVGQVGRGGDEAGLRASSLRRPRASHRPRIVSLVSSSAGVTATACSGVLTSRQR